MYYRSIELLYRLIALPSRSFFPLFFSTLSFHCFLIYSSDLVAAAGRVLFYSFIFKYALLLLFYSLVLLKAVLLYRLWWTFRTPSAHLVPPFISLFRARSSLYSTYRLPVFTEVNRRIHMGSQVFWLTVKSHTVEESIRQGGKTCIHD